MSPFKEGVLPPLKSLNWDSDTCGCKVEVRRYLIGRVPTKIHRVNGQIEVEPEKVWCQLHKLDGTVVDIPIMVTTVEEMLKSGLHHDYWKDARERQIYQIERTEELVAEIEAGQTPVDRADPEWLERLGEDVPQATDLSKLAQSMPAPRDLEGWKGVLAKVRYGKTYADYDGIRRTPGSQTRGHLSHKCQRHHNQTSTSLMEQRLYKACGCVVAQIMVGERHEEGCTHERYIDICPLHREEISAA